MNIEKFGSESKSDIKEISENNDVKEKIKDNFDFNSPIEKVENEEIDEKIENNDTIENKENDDFDFNSSIENVENKEIDEKIENNSGIENKENENFDFITPIKEIDEKIENDSVDFNNSIEETENKKIENNDIIENKSNDTLDVKTNIENDKNSVLSIENQEKDAEIKYIPKTNGVYEGEIGNSKFIPELLYIPLKSNPEKLTWGEILKKYGIDGILFKDGEPIFDEISKGNVEIEGFSGNRSDNFDKADIELAKQRGCSPEEVAKWRKENKYTWHECKDQKTMQKVPSIIHNNIPHAGGISEYKKALRNSN